MQDFWQFLLLGFVIGGVFFTIPGNNPRIHIAASLCIIATCLFLVFLGLTIAAAPWFRDITMIGMQLGLTAFYSGIAIVMIELIAYVRHAIVKEIRAR